MERQPDEQSRAAVSAILNSITDEDGDTLMQMARDTLEAMRHRRVEKTIDQAPATLTLEQAYALSKQLKP